MQTNRRRAYEQHGSTGAQVRPTRILVSVAALMVTALTTGLAYGGSYAIGLWGDLPYSDVQALTGVPNLIADMNEHELAFTVHDGDLKAGNGIPGSVTPTTCSGALYTQAL